MATGTGKTITALTLLQKLIEDASADSPWLVIIVCPFKHLVDQWYREARNFGISAVRCYESRSRWLEDFGDALAACRAGSVPFAVAITTNSTFATAHFVGLLADWQSGNFLLIGDEVHNLGSEAFRSCLPFERHAPLGALGHAGAMVRPGGGGSDSRLLRPCVLQPWVGRSDSNGRALPV
jgi:superfamily II DNA or RNA helicase